MRRQIRGLTQASNNCQDGISMVQTAEGALHEVHDMLQRMNELAVQSANGTNTSEDREALQKEFEHIQEEIDRVSQTTKFNEMRLFSEDDSNISLAGIIGGTTISSNVNLEELANNATVGDKVIIGGKEYIYSVDADGTDGETFKDWSTLQASALVNGITLVIEQKGGTQQTQTLTATNNVGDAVVGPTTAKYTSGVPGRGNYTWKTINADVTYLDANGTEQNPRQRF